MRRCAEGGAWCADIVLVMFRTGIVLIVSVLVSACGVGSGASTTSTSSDTFGQVETTVDRVDTTASQPGPSTTSTTAEPEESLDAAGVADEVVEFVAALGELMVETEYEDAVAEDPEVFVATGLLFCERLTDGVSPADLLTDYVETLTGGDIDDADDDSLTLAGSILGTAVGYFCPEHTDLLEGSL